MANGTQDLGGQIQSNAGNPVQASQDGLAATQHPLPDQMAADRYLAAKQTIVPPFGLVICGVLAGSSQGRSLNPLIDPRFC